MPDFGDVTLENAAQFESIIADTARSIILVLHDDDVSSTAFELARGMTGNEGFHCTTVWSKQIEFVRPTVERLTGNEMINWDVFGTRVASINLNDKVTFVLSRKQATDPVAILGAFFNAVGG